MRTKLLLRVLRITISALLLSATIGSAACSFRSRTVTLRPIPRDSAVPVERGDTIAIPPGGAFLSDSYVLEIPKTRTSEDRRILHPIEWLDIIQNDTRDTAAARAPKRGWVLTRIYLREVMDTLIK